jgi:cytidyltransferase-like protein
MENNKIKYNKGFIDGCFDLFHYGHVNAIIQSKAKCISLRLATHNNEEIYKAKNCYPIYSFENRLKILNECKFIDILDNDSTPYDTTIDILKDKDCDMFFHAEDGIDKYPLLDINLSNKLFIFNRTIGISTSNILSRLLAYKLNNILEIINNKKSKKYLTNLYNKIQNLDKELYNTLKINNNSNCILLKCDWDLFNENHIELIYNIKKKYGPSYKLYIDLISDCDIDENILFNKYEIRLLLSIIKNIDCILFNQCDKIFCNNLILINTNNKNIFSYNRLIIDGEYDTSISNLIIHKKDIIEKIDFDKYKHKILKIEM